MSVRLIDMLAGSADSPTPGRIIYATISGITQANPGVVTCTPHGFLAGDLVVIQAVAGMTEVNDRLFTVASPTATTFALSGVDTSLYTAYSSGGNVSLFGVLSPLGTDGVRLIYNDNGVNDRIADGARRALEQLIRDLSGLA